jgi:hypothetical protein
LKIVSRAGESNSHCMVYIRGNKLKCLQGQRGKLIEDMGC